MANLIVTKGYADGQALTKALLDTSFDDISTWLNARDNASASWLNVKITGNTTADINLLSVNGSGATTNVLINNTATDGDPGIKWQLSGATTVTAYVDDSDSDWLKFDDSSGTKLLVFTDGSGTGGIGVANGSATRPGIVFLGSTSKQTGFYKINAADEIGVGIFGTGQVKFTNGTIEPITDNNVSIGTASHRWSDVRSVLINGSDIGFANGWIFREWPCNPEDVQEKSDIWMRTNANKGIQIINDNGEITAIILRDGTIKAKKFETISEF
jgi:hypothetical protein